MPDLDIQQEQDAFDKQLDSLLEDHAGEFVLMKNRKPVEFFPSHEAAYETALDRFGIDATFLISKVEKATPQSISISWEAGVMFG